MWKLTVNLSFLYLLLFLVLTHSATQKIGIQNLHTTKVVLQKLLSQFATLKVGTQKMHNTMVNSKKPLPYSAT